MRIFCCSNTIAGIEGDNSPSFNPRCGFFAVRTFAHPGDGEIYAGFQSAMRIFCCSNSADIPADFWEINVSIRDADFLLFERQALTRSVHLTRVSIRDADFLLFEPFLSAPRISQLLLFQSAMRIFCCSNGSRTDWKSRPYEVSIRDADFLLFEPVLPVSPEYWNSQVSIRDADFLLFELGVNPETLLDKKCFNPRCGFFAVRTVVARKSTRRLWMFQSAMRIFCCSNARTAAFLADASAGFNPRCGFFAVRTTTTASNSTTSTSVSIRDADFLLFELRPDPAGNVSLKLFQSAMRIFCCSNIKRINQSLLNWLLFQSAMRIFCCSNAAQLAGLPKPIKEFQSAMRIFCCSNFPAMNMLDRILEVSIRDADFLLFEQEYRTTVDRH